MATFSGLLPTTPTQLLGIPAISGRLPVPVAAVAGGDLIASLTDLEPSDSEELRSDGTFAFTLLTSAVLSLVVISMTFQGTDQPEVAYQDGKFLGRYLGASASYAVTGGTRYVLGRAGGWPPGVTTPEVIVVDSQGVVRYL